VSSTHNASDPDTVAEANANPEAFAGKTIGQAADHFSSLIEQLERKPAVIGHSFGGLLASLTPGRSSPPRTAATGHMRSPPAW
jgi:pimeloyl-ACP methyl ester carboxylesterase